MLFYPRLAVVILFRVQESSQPPRSRSTETVSSRVVCMVSHLLFIVKVLVPSRGLSLTPAWTDVLYRETGGAQCCKLSGHWD